MGKKDTGVPASPSGHQPPASAASAAPQSDVPNADDSFALSPQDAVDGVPEELRNTPVTTQTGLAAIALNYALKYADIATCKDGTLYQQYKLEGRNLHPLHLDEVLHWATQIEGHLLNAPSRLALMVLEAIAEDIGSVLEEGASGTEAGTGETEGLDPQDDGPAPEGGDAQ